MVINTIKELTGLKKYEVWASRWSNKEGADLFSYMSEVCNPEDCLIFCRLLFPDFYAEDGVVVLQDRYDPESYGTWLGKFNGDRSAVESLMNHTHMYDVFAGCAEEVDEVIFEQLANIVALSWRLVLREKFPDRSFTVKVSNSDQDYGPVVTFFQSIG